MKNEAFTESTNTTSRRIYSCISYKYKCMIQFNTSTIKMFHWMWVGFGWILIVLLNFGVDRTRAHILQSWVMCACVRVWAPLLLIVWLVILFMPAKLFYLFDQRYNIIIRVSVIFLWTSLLSFPYLEAWR